MVWEWHRKLEARQLTLAVLAFVAVAIGGLALLIPPYFLQSTLTPIPGMRPYTALEQEGRDVYVREGCYTCHSQQVRPFKTETDRYGPYSLAGESIYDRPFQFGSRRTGPDLARVGGKYPDSWHWIHFRNPREIETRSNMPSFAFLQETPLDTSTTRRKLEVLRALGAPYSDAEVENAEADARAHLSALAQGLRAGGMTLSETEARSEALALIAYLQHLGRDLTAQTSPLKTAQVEEAR
jgi:cytochrome c oxidase cbb3-type subunit I/II